MKRRNEIFIAFLLGIVLTVPVSQAHAAQIDAFLIPEYDKAAGKFTGIKFVQLKYEPGSAVSKLFNGKNEKISFTVIGNGSGMSELIAAINQDLLKEEKSTVQIQMANLTYAGTLRGVENKLMLSYKVELLPLFSNFSLNSTGSRIIMDIDWRGFILEEPVMIDSEYGRININHPIGLLEATYPDFAAKLMDSEARGVMTEPVLDFGEIGAMPMERWHSLFDPTINYVSVKEILKTEDIGKAKVLSRYALGECSIREGCPLPKESKASISVDGDAVQVESSTPTPNAQIDIAGYTDVKRTGDTELILVDLEGQGKLELFPIQVLLVLGGMMAAVAIFVLLKARR